MFVTAGPGWLYSVSLLILAGFAVQFIYNGLVELGLAGG
jgi:hypothetical protein